ncbi:MULTISPECIES: proton-conducting transporter membrane subunit [Salegentibacter]|jgi:multicomponent Na+:H+ antiporter subunit D|uniref:Multisubunit sodium/proton antiporter, MrpD subunit n=1 Tax=Salegentibacter agarivorans TaxID=345907 RepID=A0A1I2NQL2_9FLAO|nr:MULTISPECIES: proton-conducting transporter membrane subunit [Salegentibacter]APS38341.1 cation:proton antiporter [Salegentibacter sp. T436]SFG05843.1 multisubunit sodium/proton antiporter, MrpD subunit [Salegentibacter agarivorans]
MTQQIILYPLLLQMLLAIILMFFWRKINAQRIISMFGSLVHLAVSITVFAYIWNNGTQTVQAGSWEAPFGITFIADTFSATMVLLTSIAGLAVSIFSSGSVIGDRLRFGYFPIFHFLLLGLTGAFLTGDIFNLYVWFEIIIISSFVLITIGGEKAQLEGAVKYFTLNFLASMIFLTAIAVLYGLTGSLNMADLANKVAAVENRALVEITAILFLIGFGIKSAIFPLYFWLPASYHTPPSAVSAIFGGLLTKVGVYALIRVFTLIFVDDVFLDQILLVLAIFTLFSGALGALVQNNIRKVFSYLIICHIGYMIIGLGMFTEVAIAGAIFYLVHDIVVKTNLFMISGLIYRIKGSNSMRALGGFYANYPKLSLLMFIPLFSLVGIPPLSGFWPKISLITASFESGSYWSLAAIIFASFITLVVIAKLWAEVFWKEAQEIPVRPKFRYFHAIKNIKRVQIIVPIVFLSLVSLYVGFGAEHIQTLSARIASELMDNQQYIDAVLNTQTPE